MVSNLLLSKIKSIFTLMALLSTNTGYYTKFFSSTRPNPNCVANEIQHRAQKIGIELEYISAKNTDFNDNA